VLKAYEAARRPLVAIPSTVTSAGGSCCGPPAVLARPGPRRRCVWSWTTLYARVTGSAAPLVAALLVYCSMLPGRKSLQTRLRPPPDPQGNGRTSGKGRSNRKADGVVGCGRRRTSRDGTEDTGHPAGQPPVEGRAGAVGNALWALRPPGSVKITDRPGPPGRRNTHAQNGVVAGRHSPWRPEQARGGAVDQSGRTVQPLGSVRKPFWHPAVPTFRGPTSRAVTEPRSANTGRDPPAL